MITVSTIKGGAPCSRVDQPGSHDAGADTRAIVSLDIDGAAKDLCDGCARKVFSALGFMITSVTGESIQQLVGLRKRGAKR